MKTYDRIPDLLTLLSLPPATVLRGRWHLPTCKLALGPFHAGCVTVDPLSAKPGVIWAMEHDKLWVAGRIMPHETCLTCGRRKYVGKPT